MASALKGNGQNPKACGRPPQALFRKALHPLLFAFLRMRQSSNSDRRNGSSWISLVLCDGKGWPENLRSSLVGTGVTAGTVPAVTPVCAMAFCTIAVIIVAGVSNCAVL